MPPVRKKKPKTVRSLTAAVSPFHIDVDKAMCGTAISVGGTLGIHEFSDECVLLKLADFSVRISGEGLNMTVYEQDTVEIVGKICNVEFLYDKT